VKGGGFLDIVNGVQEESPFADDPAPLPVASASVSPAFTIPVARSLPEILVNDKQLKAITLEGINALETANDPPKLFMGRAGIAAIDIDPTSQRATICTLDQHRLRGDLARAAVWVKVNSSGQSKSVYPPYDVAMDIKSRPPGEIPFPVLLGVIETPSLRADGSIIQAPGYDPQSSLYYAPRQEFGMPDVAEHPTQEEAIAAAKYIDDELLHDFKFVDRASRANYFAMLLTPIIRPAIDGATPMGMIDAPAAGSGKSLLANLVSLIAAGCPAQMRPLAKEDDEIRKSLSAMLAANPAGITVFDNLTGTISSAALAEVLTAVEFADRELGRTRDIVTRVRCTWIGTGNNISVGGDLARRCYHVRIDPECAKPFERSDFKHPNLAEWVLSHRGELVAALLTMARAWFTARMPAGGIRLGSFEKWSEMVSGILAYANVEGFMENRDDFYGESDTESADWEEFLLALRDQFHHAEFTAPEIVKSINSGNAPAVKNALPAGTAGRGSDLNATSLGKSLSNRRQRRFGKTGARVVIANKARPVIFRVDVDQEPGLEEHAA
jgi:hypothetical protein